MTIVVTGGGSGGHITPILAVAHELKQQYPNVRIVYIGQKGDPFGDVPARDSNIDETFAVSAGKFRRYYGEGIKQVFDIKTVALNVRDVSRIIVGFFQSRRLMKKLKPAVVFTRGGYVSVPVAMAAHTRHIPFITHDSDAIPSLANRLIARFATKNTVALPANIYPYDQSKTVTVGVPVRQEYVPVTADLKDAYREQAGIPKDAKAIFIIGGGQGAQRINDAVLKIASDLFARVPAMYILHVAGQANQTDMQTQYEQHLTAEQMQRVKVFGYLDDVYLYSGASDIVITRAGASSIADFAVQGKACIVVPSPFLTGGHQLKNAAYLEREQAVEQVAEDALSKQPAVLLEKIVSMLDDPDHLQALGERFTAFGNAHSASDLARLLINITEARK